MSEVEQNGRLRWQREVTIPYALDDRKQVMGVGPIGDIRIAFVGEAPGADEDRMGEPFVGRSGAYLHHYLKEVGIKSAGCYFTNVIDRKPPDTAKKNNDISSKAAVEAIEVQKDAAWQEMAWLKQRGVQVIVALGGTAAKFFGIKDSLTKSRGSIYEVSLNWKGLVTDPSNEPYDFVVTPTYHPSYIMQGKSYQKKNEEMRSDFKLAWIEDLKSAHDLAVNGYRRPVEHFTTSPTIDQVVAYCSEAIATQRLTAIDIETSGFNPQVDKIVCIGLAHTEEDGICIPLYKTGPDVMRGTRYWTPNQEAQVKHWLEQVFANCPLVLQNAVFDVGYLQQAGWEISPECVAHDTMIAHHSLSPELPHNLGFITSIYGHTPYWKGDFLSRDTTIWEMNFLDLQTYNLRDCIVLHQVIQPMLADMKEFGTESAYEEGLKLIGPIIEMQQTGALISKGRWNKWKKNLKESVERLQAEMLSIANLPANFTFAPAEVIYLLYGIESPKHEKAKEWEKHKVGSGIRASKKELFDMLQTIKPMWLGAANYTAHRNDSGIPSLDKNGIAGLRMFATNRLAALNTMKRRTTDHDEEEAQLKRFTQWLDKYAEWKRVEKMEQMFRNLPIRSDGRLHPSLLIHGTATGRLSCSNPNLQQWNKDEGADEGIREIIIAPPDHVVVAADFCVAPDQRILKADLIWEQARYLKVGDEVVGFPESSKGRSHAFERATIVDVQRFHLPRWKIITDQGNLVASEDHRILRTKELGYKGGRPRHWVKMKDIKKGDQLSYMTPPWETDNTREGGWVAGFMDGEGFVSKSVGVGQNPGPVLQRMRDYLDTHGYTYGVTEREDALHTIYLSRLRQGLRLIGSVRPTRLIIKSHTMWEGVRTWGKCSTPAKVLESFPLDDGEVVALKTTTGTYISEGFFSHNCALEFRVMAYECNDTKMLSIIEQGLNQHDENTKALFGIDKDHPKWKTYRQAAKTYQFASQYGAGNNKLHETLTIRVPEANFTMADVKKMRSNFENTYSGWAAWCHETQDRVCGNKYKRIEGTRVSENAFGRKRILYGQDYEIRNQAINNPSQSGAAHIMNDATYRIWKRLRREKLRTRLQIQIHDELRFEVPNDELQYICQLLREEMEKPIQYRDCEVAFPVNIEYGPDWYHLQEC